MHLVNVYISCWCYSLKSGMSCKENKLCKTRQKQELMIERRMIRLRSDAEKQQGTNRHVNRGHRTGAHIRGPAQLDGTGAHTGPQSKQMHGEESKSAHCGVPRNNLRYSVPSFPFIAHYGADWSVNLTRLPLFSVSHQVLPESLRAWREVHTVMEHFPLRLRWHRLQRSYVP